MASTGEALAKSSDGLIDFQLLQGGLLGGKRFAGRFVGAIGGEPDAVADGEDVVVGWNEVDGAFSGAVEAVLLVVADADHDAQQAAVIMLLVAQRAENGAGIVLVDLGDAVFDVIRRRLRCPFSAWLWSGPFLREARAAQHRRTPSRRRARKLTGCRAESHTPLRIQHRRGDRLAALQVA